MIVRYVTAAAALAAVCGMAPAQQTLQFDVNNAYFQARDAAGADAAFGGTSHTGSLVFDFSAPFTKLKSVAIRSAPDSAFENQLSYFGTLTDFDMVIELVAGAVTGGSIRLAVDTGDVYEAEIVHGIGSVKGTAIGGFTVDPLTQDGAFSDADFAGVDVGAWFAQNGSLLGYELAFKIQPTGAGNGYADADIFVVVPSPGSLACLGLAGLVVASRRRR